MKLLFLLIVEVLCLTVAINTTCFSRSIVLDTTIAGNNKISSRYLSDANTKVSGVQQSLDKSTVKILDKLSKQEKALQHKLSKIDSTASKNLFNNSEESIQRMKAKFLNKGKKYEVPVSGANYNGYLDSLQGSLLFLKGNPDLLSGNQVALDNTNSKVIVLQNKLQESENIRNYIKERKELLTTQLSKYNNLSGDIKNFSKDAYYYGEQLKSYKSKLSTRKQAEQEALKILKKLPAYQEFMERNSILAGLFNSSALASQQIEGLQTRSQLDQLIQQRLGSNPDARAAVSQQMNNAQSQLNDLKDKYPNLDNTAEMPDFKPNEMRSKSFLQRIEFGGNIQFQKSNQWYPVTSEVAGQISYKFSKKGNAGIGASYRLGWGNSISHISFSHRGVGLRSFLEWNLKKTFYLNGGFEENYNVVFADLSQLKNWNGWQGSALLGVSKKYKINNKLKGNIMLLYDFLNYKNTPRTSPFKLRIGYSF